MTFREYVAWREDTGSLNAGTAGSWSALNVSGAEFNRLGIRDKHVASDADKRKPNNGFPAKQRKSPAEIFGMPDVVDQHISPKDSLIARKMMGN